MTDITTRLLNMSEVMWMDRSQEEVDGLLLEAKGDIERLTGIGSAHDLISDWLGEGVEDLPDDTPVNVHIGGRCIIHDKLGELRAALIPQQKGNAE